MKKSFEINIPTNWDDVTIEQYINYSKLVKDLTDEGEVMIQTIIALCNIDRELVEYLKIKDIKTIYDKLILLVNSEVNKTIISKITIDGLEYGFHPNLDELTMGEYIDIETYAKDNDLPKMMSVLYRPIVDKKGNRYTLETYDTDKHLVNEHNFKKLSVNIANPIIVFFWNLGTELMIDSQISLNKEKLMHQVDTDGLQQ